MAFLVFFMIELSLHLLVDGFAYLRTSKLYMLDALTVVISFVVALLSFMGIIDTRVAITRLFRLLRLVKVSIAVQRVQARTAKWSKRGQALMNAPPTCNWCTLGTGHGCSKPKPKPGEREGKYAAFLSHYKFEAGADARYLEQQLEGYLKGANVFVDSNDLTDLSALFSEGVLKSEMIIVLGTAGILTRPWCLLELYYARKNDVPVITFALAHHNYTPASARAQIVDLEAKIPPDAVALIKEHLAAEGDSWETFIDFLFDAVDPSGKGRAGAPVYQEWHSMGADAQVNLETKGLISSMATVTDRTLVWTETGGEVAEEAPEPIGKQICDALLCRRKPKPKLYGAYVAFAADDLSVARAMQGTLQEQLGKPVLLSGKWEEVYTALRGPTAEEKAAAATTTSSTKDAKAATEEAKLAAVATATEKLEEALDCGVAQADCLLVLLTEFTLRDPFLLCEVYTALDRGVNVVPVAVAGHGWDFATAVASIKAAPERLQADDPALYDAAVEVFANSGVSMGKIQAALAKLPKLIAVTLQLNSTGAEAEEAGADDDAGAHFGIKASIAAIATRCKPQKAD